MPSAKAQVSIRDFKGQHSAAFAGALPEGAAQLQINCDTSKPGQVGPRGGWRRMTYTGGSAQESSQIIGVYRYQTPTGRDVIVYEKANGKLCGADTLTTVADATATLGAASLSTGWHASRRLCFAKTRFGDLIGVNGLDRGFRWDGITSATEALGITAPTVAPSIVQAAGGAQTAGTYTFAYRYVDNTLPTPVASSFSPTVTSVATANQKPNWTITSSGEARVASVELWRTVAGDTLTFYKVATITAGTTTYTTDTGSDTTLQASSDANTIFSENADGTPDASRFTPPPNFMSVVTLFQDRMVYCRGEKYSTGTVTTNGSTTVTGSGTAWTSAMAGRYIEISGEPAPLLISAASATSITTSTAATTSAAGKTYVVYPDPTYRRKLLYSEQDEPESVPLTNTITLQENTGDDDEITGAHQYGANLFITTDRHKYRVRWAEQPTLDGIASLIDDRGACNHWCWDVFENVAYVMDDAGAYVFTPDGGSTPISGPIQNLWDANSGERLDFSKKEKWFVQADRPNEKIHFFVCFTTDSGDYPQRRLTYNIRSQTWNPMEYTQQFGGACYWFSSGKTRVVAGGSNDQLMLLDEGTTEGVIAHVRGSPTSATSTVLTDSGASFPAGIVGAQITIIDGTGKGQKRIITARSSTTITTAAWTTTPNTTSVYLVGGLEYQWRSKRLEFIPNPTENARCVRIAFLPTSGAFWADLRLRFNNDTSPITFERSQNMGDGVVIEETNKTDAKVHFQQAYSALENAVGFAQFDFSGRLHGSAHTDHWVAIDLRGYQGDDAVEIHGIDIQGVS